MFKRVIRVDNILKIIPSNFGIGFIPLGSGTISSITANVAFYLLIFYIEDNLLVIAIWISSIVVITAISLLCIKLLGNKIDKDPKWIVSDEWVGMAITLTPLLIVNFSNTLWAMLLVMAVGFVTFGYLDIYKPLGIKQIDLMAGGKGVMLDDIAAGMIAVFPVGVAILILRLVFNVT